jgi:hypothetical protein
MWLASVEVHVCVGLIGLIGLDWTDWLGWRGLGGPMDTPFLPRWTDRPTDQPNRDLDSTTHTQQHTQHTPHLQMGAAAAGVGGGGGGGVVAMEEVQEHPHVLPLIEALADGTHLYLVFPYADGGELFEVRMRAVCVGFVCVLVRGWWLLIPVLSRSTKNPTHPPQPHQPPGTPRNTRHPHPRPHTPHPHRPSPPAPRACRSRRRAVTSPRSSRVCSTSSGTAWRMGEREQGERGKGRGGGVEMIGSEEMGVCVCRERGCARVCLCLCARVGGCVCV